jgi:hypothetical protein
MGHNDCSRKGPFAGASHYHADFPMAAMNDFYAVAQGNGTTLFAKFGEQQGR